MIRRHTDRYDLDTYLYVETTFKIRLLQRSRFYRTVALSADLGERALARLHFI